MMLRSARPAPLAGALRAALCSLAAACAAVPLAQAASQAASPAASQAASPTALPAASPATPGATRSGEPLEELVVTASRMPQSRLDVAASLSRLDGDAIALAGATHSSELLNRLPGVYIQRGNGQESLVAIRSPVLTGPGACGAFLVLEDGLTARPVGFCNVNELFELNVEQAGAIEVIRGPGPAAYGANALHGIVNVISPAARSLPEIAGALEGGPDGYRRVKFAAGTDRALDGIGAYGMLTRDGGFRADSGYDEAKLNLLGDAQLAGGTLRLRASGTVLNQETAGFVQGFRAYADPVLRRSNPNPESYRDAWSARASAQWTRDAPCAGCSDALRAVVRRSSMEFMQHFLLGEPIERNGQRSIALVASSARRPFASLGVQAGVDGELSDSSLLEYQPWATTGGTAAQRAIRPAGRHYDYTVAAATAGAFAEADWQPAPRWHVGAAVRIEQTRYRYDDRMIDGNTNDAGVPCASGGCLYSRPADRTDRFANVAPKLDLRFELAPGQRLYVSASRGFRPPETTELYRLQRQQSVADLHSERVDGIEAGWLLQSSRLDTAVSAYALRKRNVILRDSNGFNVDDGRTTHRGIEYELRWRTTDTLTLTAAGTVAWHRYDFSETVDGGETIVSGRDVDTAPRNVNRVAVAWRPHPQLSTELEAMQLGRYWLDAANAHSYPGHVLLGARAKLDVAHGWHATLRIVNLTDRAYADRADFAFGQYRYFPGRPRAAFLEIGWAPP